MAFLWQDVEIYDELCDELGPDPIALTSGQARVIQECFSFLLQTQELANQELTPVYRCRQVKASKRVGTGEDILHGDRLYAYPLGGLPVTQFQDFEVSPNAVGVAGTDFVFCGWAKEDAPAAAEFVLMNFDGTRPDQLF